MNEIEFDKGLELVEIQFGRFDPALREYLHGRWISYSGEIWMRICSWIVDHCGTRPKANKFREAHTAVAPSYFTSTRNEKGGDCPDCRGYGFHEVFFLVEDTSIPYRGVTPCSSCNSNQFMPEMRVRISKYITRMEYLALQKDGLEGHPGGEGGIQEVSISTASDDSGVEAWIKDL